MGSPPEQTTPEPMFRLLGPVEVYDGPVQVVLPKRGKRLRAVLAALLVLSAETRTSVAAEVLADVVAGEGETITVSTLRSHVLRLRRALPPRARARLVTESGYLLRASADEVDFRLFRRLAEEGNTALQQGSWARADKLLGDALALWRGEPLADIPSGSRIRDEVPALEEMRLLAEEWQADAALALGRHAELVPSLRRLVVREPLRERFHAQLMLALYRAGRQAEALAAYRHARKVLDDELGAEPGDDLRALHQQILSRDPGLALPGLAVTANPGPGLVMPQELPQAVLGFTGRTAELKELDDILDEEADAGEPGTVVTVVISGAAGVGKTTLALRWAHRVAAQFSDGQLYVNLRGFDPAGAPADPAEVIRGLLDTLGVAVGSLPSSPDAQAGRYRSILDGRKMLIVLDNARDAAQVRPLLPASPGCMVVITSRSQLPGLAAANGARLITLGVLPPGDAVQLLNARIGRRRAAAEPAAIAQIAGLCGGLPLALAVAAARAQARPRLKLADLAADLKDAARRLDALDAGDDPSASVRAVFSWSYQKLSDDAARMFRLLGVHPGPDIDVAAAARLAGVGEPDALRALEELEDSHLIAGHASRYAFHDLVRAYAADLADKGDSNEDRAAAVGRVLDHYLHSASNCYMLLSPELEPLDRPPAKCGTRAERPGDALAWFAAEHQVLHGAVQLAADAGAYRHAWQLGCAITEYLRRRGYLQERVGVMTTAVEAAGHLDDPRGQAMSLRALGSCYLDTGDYDQARDCVEGSLHLYRGTDDAIGEAVALQTLSLIAQAQDRWAEALGHSERALGLFRARGHQLGEVLALNNIGWFCAHLGRYKKARSSCRKALALIETLDRCDFAGGVWDTAGYIERQAGNLAAAIAHYEQAVHLDGLAYGTRSDLAESLEHLGDAHHDAGHLEEARKYRIHARDIYRETGHPGAAEVIAKLSQEQGETAGAARGAGS